MPLRSQLDDDVKAALLAGDSLRVETLRGLKSVILYADVAAKRRDTGGIPDDEIIPLLAREAKKRQESADLYVQGGSQERADKELAEKAIIEGYLPQQLSEAEIAELVDAVIIEQRAEGMQAMGKVIGAVKAKAGNAADGSIIARLVKERLNP
ncbi:MAG TPA: GatB/YqeY domain-containing protein [Candidatus Saccharimonadales bacterium]|nr:GatB/YqeY domain-containing protein [Candidatus Saccharimonadales bacterium]